MHKYHEFSIYGIISLKTDFSNMISVEGIIHFYYKRKLKLKRFSLI